MDVNPDTALLALSEARYDADAATMEILSKKVGTDIATLQILENESQQQQQQQQQQRQRQQQQLQQFQHSIDSAYSNASSWCDFPPIVEWEKSINENGGVQNACDDKIEGGKRVIQDLHKAIGHERRIAAISNACAEFDHWDTEKHNTELEHGAANMLCLVLSMTEEEDEIRMICAALEMVHRASTEMVCKSFQDVGPKAIPLLLRFLQRCENTNMKHAEVSILNITKVLLYFSRVAKLRDPLARHPDLLSALTRIGTAALNPDSRVLRMRVIANLSSFEDNKMLMMEHDGLIPAVLKVAALDLSEGAREFASACLMDIAWSPNTQVELAKNEKLLSTLIKLAVTDDKDETRVYAVTATQKLAFRKENRTIMVHYSNGAVLEALKKIICIRTNDFF